MTNKNITSLSAATTPLAGTEILAIVQSGTKKVATDDLTVKNIRSNVTTGILQIAGPAAASTRVVTVPDANWTAARTDAVQSFTGDQTLATGNLVQGTAAKGVNFTANTPAAGMTSQLLNWYEEGTWTPVVSDASTAGNLATGTFYGHYTRIGNRVTLTVSLATIGTAGMTAGNDLHIQGAPFTSKALTGNVYAIGSVWMANATVANNPCFAMLDGVTYFRVGETMVGAAADFMIVSEFTTGTATIYGTISYQV